MRAQVMVMGPVERKLRAVLDEELLPAGTKRALELAWTASGAGLEVAERLIGLDLSAGILTGMGASGEDQALLTALRRRGIQTRGIQAGAHATPVTLELTTPTREVSVVSPRGEWVPSAEHVRKTLRGCRHVHVCEAFLHPQATRGRAHQALKQARLAGATTSLDLERTLQPHQSSTELETLLSRVDVLFTDSNAIRACAGESRLGAAVEWARAHGVRSVSVRLGVSGRRVYDERAATRIPAMGASHEKGTGAFASGYLLGWLLGMNAAACGLLGSACAAEEREPVPPSRRRVAAQLSHARQDPDFRKLVDSLREAERLLSRPRRLAPRRKKAPKR